MAKTRVMVTGATGFVARHVRRHLSNGGAEISSVSRRDFNTFQNEQGIITKSYDSGLLPHMQNHDALIHLIGVGSQSIRHDFDSVNFGLAKKITGLCVRAGIKKIVYLSGLGVSRYSTLGYFISKYKAENEIRHSGLDFTIFRPSYIVGKDDLLTKKLNRQIRRGLVTIPGSGRFCIQPVSINDASRIICDSITGKKFSNKILDLVGPETVTFEDYVRRFLGTARTDVKKIPFEKAYHDAISGIGDFGVDDLNLLAGDFHGNSRLLEDAWGTRLCSP